MLEKITNLQEELKVIGVNVRELQPYHINNKFYDEIDINERDDFEIIYNKKDNKFILNTTWSNQNINRDYLNLLSNILNILDKYNK